MNVGPLVTRLAFSLIFVLALTGSWPSRARAQDAATPTLTSHHHESTPDQGDGFSGQNQ